MSIGRECLIGDMSDSTTASSRNVFGHSISKNAWDGLDILADVSTSDPVAGVEGKARDVQVSKYMT